MARVTRAAHWRAGASGVAVSYHDYATETSWSYHGDRWFHAASTIKVVAAAIPRSLIRYSPAEIPRGPHYRFNMNHVVEPAHPLEMFSIDYESVGS